MEIAEKKGIIYRVNKEIKTPSTRKGNFKLYNSVNFEKRGKNFQHILPTVKKVSCNEFILIIKWWNSLNKVDGKLSKDLYIEMVSLIYMILVPDGDIESAKQIALVPFLYTCI